MHKRSAAQRLDMAPGCGGTHHPAPRRRAAGGAAALLLAVALTACAMPRHPDASAQDSDPFNPAAAQLLDNTSWNLTRWQPPHGAARDLPGGDRPLTLALSTTDGKRRASGFSGCNRFTGPYELTDGRLRVGPLAATRMACVAGNELESAYLDALAHVSRTGVQMKPPQQLELILDTGDVLVFDRADHGQ